MTPLSKIGLCFVLLLTASSLVHGDCKCERPANGETTHWGGNMQVSIALRRFHGTAVRTESNLETTSKALGNSKTVADKHYVKPVEVLPDVRRVVNDAVSGLTAEQPLFN